MIHLIVITFSSANYVVLGNWNWENGRVASTTGVNKPSYVVYLDTATGVISVVDSETLDIIVSYNTTPNLAGLVGTQYDREDSIQLNNGDENGRVVSGKVDNTPYYVCLDMTTSSILVVNAATGIVLQEFDLTDVTISPNVVYDPSSLTYIGNNNSKGVYFSGKVDDSDDWICVINNNPSNELGCPEIQLVHTLDGTIKRAYATNCGD